MAHLGEPFVEIHPADAERGRARRRRTSRYRSAHGRAVLRVVVTERQRRGSLFAPMHWTDQLRLAGAHRRADRRRGRSRLRPAGAQIHAGQGAALRSAWHGFAVSRTRGSRPRGADYFALARAQAAGGRNWRAAPRPRTGRRSRARCSGWTRDAEMSPITTPPAVSAVSSRSPAGYSSGRCSSRASRSPRPAGWLADAPRRANRPGGRAPQAARRTARRRGARPRPDRLRLLRRRPQRDPRGGARTAAARVAAIGERLKAGTNCGSCRGEIARLVGSEAHTPRRSGPLQKSVSCGPA